VEEHEGRKKAKEEGKRKKRESVREFGEHGVEPVPLETLTTNH
jgi:hypothetical protein